MTMSRLRLTLLALEIFTGAWAIDGAVMLVTDAWHLPVGDLAPLPLLGLAVAALAWSWRGGRHA